MCRPWKRYTKRRYPVVDDLRREREARGIPRKVVGHSLGYHMMTVGRWERGESLPSLQALNDWCEALGVTLTIVRVHGPYSQAELDQRRPE